MTFNPFKTSLLGAAALSLLLATVAQAHVSVEPAEAPAGSSAKVALRIGHGCEGTATHTVTVRIPAGFRGAKPMPKPGWKLSIRKDKLAEPYDSHGRKVTEDVVEITWQATAREFWLEDAWYDEFVVRGQLPGQAGPLWWPVQQVCEKGRWDWVEVPKEGASVQGLKAPAARMNLVADPHAGHAH